MKHYEDLIDEIEPVEEKSSYFDIYLRPESGKEKLYTEFCK